MSKGMPSLMALLGLAAVAGYQNRDKLGDLVENLVTPTRDSAKVPDTAGPNGGAEDMAGGLGTLIERFNTAGYGTVARSWVSYGPNTELAPDQLEQVLGADTIAELSQKTGLSAPELLKRLTGALPEVVDRLTPDGHIPAVTT